MRAAARALAHRRGHRLVSESRTAAHAALNSIGEITCVTPVEVSYDSSEEVRWHGHTDRHSTVKVTTPLTSLRVPDAPTFEKGSVTEKICPLVTVKDVAEPITVPLEFTN